MGKREDPTLPPGKHPIAKIAIERSRPLAREEQAPSAEEERMLRSLRQWEQQMAAMVEELRRERDVHPPRPRQESSSPPPPPSRASKPETHWLAHLATAITAVGATAAAIVALVNALHKDPVQPVTQEQLKAVVTAQAKTDQAFRDYLLSMRSLTVDVWGLQGVKVVDPPGAPPRLPLEVCPDPSSAGPCLLPQPLVSQTRHGSTHVPAAPLLQLRDPLPLPPAP